MEKLRNEIVIIIVIFLVSYRLYGQEKNKTNFYKYFTLVDTVFFNIDSLIIGDIDDVIVL